MGELRSTSRSLSQYNDYAISWTIGVRFPTGQGFYFFNIMSRLTLGSTQPPIQWVLGALSPRAKQPEHESDHSSPYSAEIKTVTLNLHYPMSSGHGAYLTQDMSSWNGTYLSTGKNLHLFMGDMRTYKILVGEPEG
jgi:hypothetical protein